ADCLEPPGHPTFRIVLMLPAPSGWPWPAAFNKQYFSIRQMNPLFETRKPREMALGPVAGGARRALARRPARDRRRSRWSPCQRPAGWPCAARQGRGALGRRGGINGMMLKNDIAFHSLKRKPPWERTGGMVPPREKERREDRFP